MTYLKKVLVVDDQPVNRRILCRILQDSYQPVEACDGQDALEYLHIHGTEISLVLLDIVMPRLDGYGFLAAIKDDPVLSAIPVIVTTGNNSQEDEIRCLTCGASDFVTKPFNAEIVRHRVESIIRLREKSSLVNQVEYDRLTGAYSKEVFYQYVKDVLTANPEQQYDIIVSDVESFKLINETYGTEAGDRLLNAIAARHIKYVGEGGLCGRISADVFAVLTTRRDQYSNQSFQRLSHDIAKESPVPKAIIKFGIYQVEARDLPVSYMCDRALLALQSIKQKYGVFFSIYDDTLRLKLLRNQQILDSMEQALQEQQFLIYLQPKHEVRTHAISGAEALVRWQHPKFGFMSPGDFIPLFEKNGFITRLDQFVWEEACKQLKKWQNAGTALIPISVNVSRADFLSCNVPEHFSCLTAKYGIPNEMLHLEVTETAYTENPQQLISAVEALRTIGFAIEMDDFGSGYSSLNMLNELPIDILKLDMRFMKQHHRQQDTERSILSFILNLGQWLGLPTVAEGVETAEELALLERMGCNYVQGFYFAKPMPCAEFDEYRQKNKTMEKQKSLSAFEREEK